MNHRPWTLRAYAACGTAAAPLIRAHLRRRARTGKEIATRLGEREGVDRSARPPGPLIWLHAVSVGETQAILPLAGRLAPHASILLTTGTITGAETLARGRAALGPDAARILHRFAPHDVPSWIARFLDHWQPNLAVFLESELWPNRIAACRRRAIPMMLLNARISPASFRRWQRLPRTARSLLDSFTTIWARGPEDAARLRALGAHNVETAGDLKHAAAPLPCDPEALAALRRQLSGRPVWVAASTHPGEEAAIAALHPRLAARHPGLVTILAPRHPDRGPALADALGAPRRSAGAGPDDGGLWIADTLGELGLWYRLAPVAFVGRSLFPPGGGQNPLEPARLGCAIAVGPHTANFAEHVALLAQDDALRVVPDPEALAAFVSAMLADTPARTAMGARAAALATRDADLPDRAARAILALVGGP